MLVPVEWLKEYVKIEISTEQLAELMTMSGSKVEGIHRSNDFDAEDEVIDFEITSNRPDCLSILGIAKEVSATIGTNLISPEKIISSYSNTICDYAKVLVEEKDLCPRYCARVVTDIVVRPSPEWMQKRLVLAGIRPVNNVVDITNYVMIEMGQPLHAFDLDKVNKQTIVVRRAFDSELILTLDGKERKLSHDMLVISDPDNAIGIAGVMGGSATEVTTETKCIILESAKFDRTNIRLTSKSLSLRSEASTRFEKGIPSTLTSRAIDRAAFLMQKLNVGQVVDGLIDICAENSIVKKIVLDCDRINSLLGLDLSLENIKSILKRVEIEFETENEVCIAIIPGDREDIEGIADLAEEVARLYGYDLIPLTMLSNSITRGYKTIRQKQIDEIKETLIGTGFYETITYSFTNPKIYSHLGYEREEDYPNFIRIANPLGEDYSIMRTTLIPSMLEVLTGNYAKGVTNAKIFEIASAFLPKELPLVSLPIETPLVTFCEYGENLDFFKFKGIVELLISRMTNSKCVSFQAHNHQSFHPGRTALVKCNDIVLGIFGEIHPAVATSFKMKDLRIMLAEIDLDILLNSSNMIKKYTPLPKYPSVKRDVAIIVKKTLPAELVNKLIKVHAGDLLSQLVLFDVYEGTQIPDDSKSLAYTLIYRADDRTLRDDEVNALHAKVIYGLKNELDVIIR